jgi:hypothetical protein
MGNDEYAGGRGLARRAVSLVPGPCAELRISTVGRPGKRAMVMRITAERAGAALGGAGVRGMMRSHRPVTA